MRPRNRRSGAFQLVDSAVAGVVRPSGGGCLPCPMATVGYKTWSAVTVTSIRCEGNNMAQPSLSCDFDYYVQGGPGLVDRSTMPVGGDESAPSSDPISPFSLEKTLLLHEEGTGPRKHWRQRVRACGSLSGLRCSFTEYRGAACSSGLHASNAEANQRRIIGEVGPAP